MIKRQPECPIKLERRLQLHLFHALNKLITHERETAHKVDLCRMVARFMMNEMKKLWCMLHARTHTHSDYERIEYNSIRRQKGEGNHFYRSCKQKKCLNSTYDR